MKNHPLSAEYLIKWGANVSCNKSYGYTPLITASAHHNTDSVKLLLDHHSPTGESLCVCSYWYLCLVTVQPPSHYSVAW